MSDDSRRELAPTSRFQALLFVVSERNDEVPIGQLASIELQTTPHGVVARVVGGSLGLFEGRGESIDEALVRLWTDLESSGTRLSINRFRRNAFMTGLARQMGDGLACYLVERGRCVGPEYIAPSLSSTDPRSVVSPMENADYIKSWSEHLNRDRFLRTFPELGAAASIFVLVLIGSVALARGSESWIVTAIPVLLGLVGMTPLRRFKRDRQ